jgi:hypothetical protein
MFALFATSTRRYVHRQVSIFLGDMLQLEHKN